MHIENVQGYRANSDVRDFAQGRECQSDDVPFVSALFSECQSEGINRETN